MVREPVFPSVIAQGDDVIAQQISSAIGFFHTKPYVESGILAIASYGKPCGDPSTDIKLLFHCRKFPPHIKHILSIYVIESGKQKDRKGRFEKGIPIRRPRPGEVPAPIYRGCRDNGEEAEQGQATS